MKQIMIGNQAFARGAYEAGVRVVSSYPGTPSTEITEFATGYDEMHVEWAPNEKVGVEVATGAAISGARALSCMKHVGLNVAADPLFTAAYTGINGGLVLIVADDNGCHSSQNEQDTRYYGLAAGVPVLEPSDAQECKDFVKIAYEISEAYDEPVIIRSNTRVSHSRSLVELGERVELPLKEYTRNVGKFIPMPAMARKLHVLQEERLKRLEEAANTLSINRIEQGDGKIGVITSSISYQYVKEALPNASVLKIGMANPLPKKLISEFANSVETLYVVEEGPAFMETQIKAMGISVTGKELFTIQGEYSTAMVKRAIGKEMVPDPVKTEAPVRPPAFCAGCPHRAVFHLLGKLNMVVTGDIGCYTLGANPPLSAMDTTLCMGASITVAHGMEMARGKDYARKVVAVIGDSTFLHSGLTGLINMNYNGSTGTVIILDNRITGMTGHQDNPGTGKNAKGEPAPAVDFKELATACGVKHVVEVDPFDLAALEAAIKEETAREAVSVIIAKHPCALIDKTKKPKYEITDACKRCKQCLKIGCPAIEVKGDRVVIAKERCNGCGLCSQICRFDAIKAGK